MADFLVELMQAAQPDGGGDGSGGKSEGAGGQVIEFRRAETPDEDEPR